MYNIKSSIMRLLARYKLCIFVIINMVMCTAALMVMYYLNILRIGYAAIMLLYFATAISVKFTKYVHKNDEIAYNISKININSVEIRIKNESNSTLLQWDTNFKVPDSFGQISKHKFINLINSLARDMKVYSLGFDMFPVFYVDNTDENNNIIEEIQENAPEYMRVVDCGPEIEISDIIHNIEMYDQEDGCRLRVCKGVECEEYKLYKCVD